jgi:hypothetical protein
MKKNIVIVTLVVTLVAVMGLSVNKYDELMAAYNETIEANEQFSQSNVKLNKMVKEERTWKEGALKALYEKQNESLAERVANDYAKINVNDDVYVIDENGNVCHVIEDDNGGLTYVSLSDNVNVK